MYHTEHSIHIEATPAAVWAVLTDVEHSPAWTPTMSKVERMDSGPFGPTSRARVKLVGFPATVWRVTQFDDGHSFTWVAETGPHVVATHVVEPDGAGTKLTFGIDTSGALALVFSPLLRWVSPRNIRREAAGLKAHCERAASA
jgi:carbon monoxide dehydrogenase subunit G